MNTAICLTLRLLITLDKILIVLQRVLKNEKTDIHLTVRLSIRYKKMLKILHSTKI